MDKKEMPDNCILVGKKPMRCYSDAVNVQLDEKKSKEVILKSRGKFVLTAINTAEYVKRKSEGKIVPVDVKIGSESFIDKEKDREIFVSTIEIKLVKN